MYTAKHRDEVFLDDGDGMPMARCVGIDVFAALSLVPKDRLTRRCRLIQLTYNSLDNKDGVNPVHWARVLEAPGL